MSDRFLRSAQRASPSLQILARQETAHLLEVRHSQRDWVGQYEHVKGLGAGTVLELDLGGGPRMLVHVGAGDEVTLLDMGGHEIVRRYRRTLLVKDLADRRPLDPAYRPGARVPVFVSGVRGSHGSYANETRPEWLYFLDDEQTETTADIVGAVEDALLGDRSGAIHFLVGGPGTGKTSVLLQLLMRLSDGVVDNKEDWDVRLDIGTRLADFITASTGWDLSAVREPVSAEAGADVVLVDDPLDVDQIQYYMWLVREGIVGAVVVGFDALQLRDSLNDSAYAKLMSDFDVSEHVISSCYRQKALVGAASTRVADAISASSPFLDSGKQRRYASERERLTSMANQLRFPNPAGRVVVVEDARHSDLVDHLAWMTEAPMWEHWPPFLLVQDEAVKLPAKWQKAMEDIRHERVGLRNVQAIKGLEYQHVALVLGGSRYRSLKNGFTGSGRAVYNEYRLLRIPFSRAKDSIATFVLPE